MSKTDTPKGITYSRNRAGFAHLYPAINPYDFGWLDVGDGHRIYWETSGNPEGIPALLLHGGPGGSSNTRNRRFFDPNQYCIIAFDQRGCGRSKPAGELHANTTAHLINDIELLRTHLNIKKWLLFGGSWGATLALAYAQAYPQRVSRLVLRGVFTARACELQWLYQGGAANFYPEAWQAFLQPIAMEHRNNIVAAYATGLGGANTDAAIALAKAWCAWEDALMAGASYPPATSTGPVEPAGSIRPASQTDSGDLNAWVTARIGAHYVAHGAFLEDGALLAEADRLEGVPGDIVQGRYDLVTPMATAWALHKAWPGSTLHIVEGAGHASDEPGVTRALLESTQAPSSVSMSGT